MKKFGILLLLATLLLSGCQVEKQRVAYTVYPIGYLLERIGQDKIDVVSIQEDELIQRANLKSDYLTIVEESNIFLHIGELEPYLSIYYSDIADTSNLLIKDLSSLNAIYPFKRYTRVLIDGKESFIEGPYYSGDAFNSIDVNERDLFLWADPIGMISMAKDIERLLSSDYVEMASTFGTNLEKLENDLITLDAQFQQLSDFCRKNNKTIKFVSMTASFGNWQKNYGFQVYPVVLSKFGALPTVDQLELIKKRIVDDGVKYIAYEPNMPQDMIDLFNTLETELSLTRVNLNNISSLTESQKTDNKDYLSLMYENLGVLENMISDIEKVEPTADPEETESPTTDEE